MTGPLILGVGQTQWFIKYPESNFPEVFFLGKHGATFSRDAKGRV
jgi:hypothetical protein